MSSCPTFGTDQPSQLSRSTLESVFMNFEAPSQCSGTVTSWRFCYYRNYDDNDGGGGGQFDNTPDNREFVAIFLVYRRQAPRSSNYGAVSESVREVTLQWRTVKTSQFDCMDEVLNSEDYFEIQENDIVGACIKNFLSIGDYPLLLVGMSRELNLSTYQYHDAGYQLCGSSLINNLDTSDSDFVQRNQYVLHLHANISVASDFRAGNNPPPAQALISNFSGTYLNIHSPVTYGNQITKWHYCYYTEAATPESTLSMIVAVWSLDQDSRTYVLSPGSNLTINLNPIQTLAKIFCTERSLTENEFVIVSAGDFIGVVLPPTDAIPIVGINASSPTMILRHSADGCPVNLVESEFTELSTSVLHLYATIIHRDLPTSSTTAEITAAPLTSAVPIPNSTSGYSSAFRPQSSSVPTTNPAVSYTSNAEYTASSSVETMTTNMHDDSENSQRGHNLAGGVIAAIVISVLILFCGVLLVVVALIMYIIQRNSRKYSAEVKSGIGNIMYIKSSYSGQEGDINTYDVVAEPYTYSESMVQIQGNLPHQLHKSMPDYQNTDDTYCMPMDSTHAYQQEIDNIKRGISAATPENIYMDPGNNEEEIYSFLKKKRIRHIPGQALSIGYKLGSGQFGRVHQGEWKQAPKQIVQVAVKSLNQDASSSDRVKFLQEAATMGQFRHPNVAALYGVANKDGEMHLVVELLPKGDLQHYLKALIPVSGELVNASTSNLLLQFSQQVCLGMSYLASTGFIHRDLAARNVLLSDSLICKIADFGMSRDLNDGDYYTSSGGKIPLKWTAPEAIHYKKYSTASDVWSYGCVLYEIWSLGHKPFEDIGNVEVLKVLDSGGRLAPPPGCPKSIYEMMIQCWNSEPKQRPKFRDILMATLENEDSVLHIPSEDASTHPQAATLGSPLKTGFSMYTDLQKMYI